MKGIMGRIAWVFVSRKNQTAIVTLVLAASAHYGLKVQEQTLYLIVGLGATLIAAIALEDHGKHLAAGKK